MNSNDTQKKNVDLILYALSFGILVFLFWLIYFRPPIDAQNLHQVPAFVPYLPLINAVFNTLTATCLIMAYRAIRLPVTNDSKDLKDLKDYRVQRHVRFIFSALFFSTLFLMSYVLYHFYAGDTKFLARGVIRPIYFFILISHILLSIIQIPLILITLQRAFTKNFVSHKKFAKFTFPIWLYVSITGVLIFVFLKIFNTVE